MMNRLFHYIIKSKKILKDDNIEVFHFDKVIPNPKKETVEEGFEFLKINNCDVVLAVGGGSSIDVSKALAFTFGKEKVEWDEILKYDSPFKDYETYNKKTLPLISIPTTAGTGSQVTQASVITIGKEKVSFYHKDLFSKECIIDSELTLTLPNRITSATGFDAFTHAFESYISKRASFYSEQDSISAMKLIIEYLPKVLKDPKNLEYRKNLSLADTLAGRALSNSGANAPHPLSELIGGISNMPHGEALAIVFPAFIKYSYKTYEEKMKIVEQLFPYEGDLYNKITEFLKEINLLVKMKDYNISKEDLDEMISCPMLDHLPFGNREFLESILKESF